SFIAGSPTVPAVTSRDSSEPMPILPRHITKQKPIDTIDARWLSIRHSRPATTNSSIGSKEGGLFAFVQEDVSCRRLPIKEEFEID
ncbi:hypothetical protein E4U46_008390, partial [Claviceps purpurea]